MSNHFSAPNLKQPSVWGGLIAADRAQLRRSPRLLPSTPRRWSRHRWPPLSGRLRRLASASPRSRPLWKDRPSRFLVAEEDRMIPAETQRFMAERMKARVHIVPRDHVPMITKASAVVDVLMEAVREAAKLR